MAISLNVVFVISIIDSNTGLRNNLAVFTGNKPDKIASCILNNKDKCPEIEFFRINSEDNRFNTDEELEIDKFLRELEDL